MLINLHKKFCFSWQNDIYQVGYVFEKDAGESNGAIAGDICLIITYSKNQGDKITDKTNKASAIFSQSNENIQKFIETTILSCN